MVRMPVLDVRLEDALGAGTVLAKFAGKVPLLGVYRPDVCLKISLLYRDELAEAATEHLHIVVDRIDVDLGVRERKTENNEDDEHVTQLENETDATRQPCLTFSSPFCLVEKSHRVHT